ncbi:hypothetical protein GGX14DRAFT_406095 [Mycena pura]|uniref:Uncharacterized protein n=1 Tax=Mycena pura TaxID=153505 RepID=A0AAD6UTZ7_9AGAR|nr:hypothetical protein GGX14DRAFT_406095 [Mycena pura]
MQMEGGPSIIASFTDSGPVDCGRGVECKGQRHYPAGTRLRSISVRNYDKPTAQHATSTTKARRLLLDATSLAESPATPTFRPQVPRREKKIYGLTNAAQRHEKVPVQALGSMGPPLAARTNIQSRPNVSHSSGYSTSHAQYQEALARAQASAFAQHSGFVGKVDIRLVHVPPGAIKHQKLGSCGTILSDIPVHIKPPDLLTVAFTSIYSKFNDEVELNFPGKTFPLSVHDITLCDKDRAPINMEKIDPIAPHFFKANKKSGGAGYARWRELHWTSPSSAVSMPLRARWRL